jgi:hypothetical protein
MVAEAGPLAQALEAMGDRVGVIRTVGPFRGREHPPALAWHRLQRVGHDGVEGDCPVPSGLREEPRLGSNGKNPFPFLYQPKTSFCSVFFRVFIIISNDTTPNVLSQ